MLRNPPIVRERLYDETQARLQMPVSQGPGRSACCAMLRGNAVWPFQRAQATEGKRKALQEKAVQRQATPKALINALTGEVPSEKFMRTRPQPCGRPFAVRIRTLWGGKDAVVGCRELFVLDWFHVWIQLALQKSGVSVVKRHRNQRRCSWFGPRGAPAQVHST